jgi:DegT/DnrJ/EryC1/StrS aminotransferase family
MWRTDECTSPRVPRRPRRFLAQTAKPSADGGGYVAPSIHVIPQDGTGRERLRGVLQCHHCVGTASGLDALRFALLATGVEPGAEVIVQAYTFVATLEAVTQARPVPVPVDVTEADCSLDPCSVQAAITPCTPAVVARAPLRADGRPAPARGARRTLRAGGGRGCLPGLRADRDGIGSGTAKE